jgi:hypothetical protein
MQNLRSDARMPALFWRATSAVLGDSLAAPRTTLVGRRNRTARPDNGSFDSRAVDQSDLSCSSIQINGRLPPRSTICGGRLSR